MTEHDDQSAVFEWYRVAQYKWPELVMYANANASRMSYGAASWMRKEGRTSGIPDITVSVPRCGFGALYIEMKSAKGRLSDAQKHMIDRLTKAGNKCVVCRSAKEAIDEITAYITGQNI